MRWGGILFIVSVAAPALGAPTPGSISVHDLSEGSGLYTLCSSPRSADQELVCQAYVRGLLDGFREERSDCIPSGIPYDQAVGILIRFIEQNPALRHLSSASLTKLSMLLAFNCGTERVPPKK